jgi:hypothetical protein
MTILAPGNLAIEATGSSPRVRGDAAARTLELSGESYPENSFEFFRPVLAWVRPLLAGEGAALALDLRLLYLNTSSIKCLMDLLDLMEDAHRAGGSVSVTWRYDAENDRALDLAEEFREDLTLPFHLVPVPAEDA